MITGEWAIGGIRYEKKLHQNSNLKMITGERAKCGTWYNKDNSKV